MAEAAIRTIVEAIHSSPTQAVVYLSGGASQVCLSLYLQAILCDFFFSDVILIQNYFLSL